MYVKYVLSQLLQFLTSLNLNEVLLQSSISTHSCEDSEGCWQSTSLSRKWAKPAAFFFLLSMPKSNSDILPAVSFSQFHSVYPSDLTFTSSPTPAFFSSSLHLTAMFLPRFLRTQSILPILANCKTPPQMRETMSQPMSVLRVTAIAACSKPSPFNEIQEPRELLMSLSSLSKNMGIGDSWKKEE